MLSFRKYVTVQVRRDIYGFSNFDRAATFLKCAGGFLSERARPGVGRASPSMVSYGDAFIFLIGGGSMDDFRKFEDGVEVYSTEKDSWALGPPLKQSRQNHSSCSVKHMIYTFCGCNFLDGDLASIERLNARDFLLGTHLGGV